MLPVYTEINDEYTGNPEHDRSCAVQHSPKSAVEESSLAQYMSVSG
jgi:hypothetical protein